MNRENLNRDDRKVFLHAGLIALFVVLSAAAMAEEQIPCWKARAALAWAGTESGAEKIARKHGYTQRQIEEAKRRCR
jgi:hypothetical protein